MVRRRPRFDHGQPIIRSNLAPFVGVLLLWPVLAMALFPPPTHALLIDLPSAWIPVPDPPADEEVHWIEIARDGQLSFNQEPVDAARLRRILQSLLLEPIEPEVRLDPHAKVPYPAVLAVLGLVKQSGITKFCFAELERYRVFDKEWSRQPMRLTLVDPPERIPFEVTDPPPCASRPEGIDPGRRPAFDPPDRP